MVGKKNLAARRPLRELNSPASCFLMFISRHFEKTRNNLSNVEELCVKPLLTKPQQN